MYAVDETPPVDSMRCVPRAWCKQTKLAPRQIWNDAGGGGGKPGSMWVINSLNMVAVIPGQEPPKEPSYELESDRFYVHEGSEINDVGDIVFKKISQVK